MLIHTVQPGETLSSIAGTYGVPPSLLRSDNGVGTDDALAIGQALVIRFPETLHVVREGETLSSIAASYGLTARQLLRRNYGLLGSSALLPGQVLVISSLEEKLGKIATNGYAYPYIEQAALAATLPYMTFLTPFTYGLDSQGNLLPLEDGPLLSSAGAAGSRPLLHLSSLTEDGQFSNQRAQLVLSSPGMQSSLIDQVLATLSEKGYQGVDVDFEFLSGTYREAYVAFLQTLHSRLAPLGLPLFTALAPKTYAGQPGILYEAHDYAAMGAAADYLLVMTYEWGYTYGPPMAVAPLPNVRSVLDYAVTEIPREKLLMGIPTYGYDWPLPFRQGVTAARSLSNPEAVALARQYDIAILYDETAQSPYFYYTDPSGTEHAVWFEDARSLSAKLRLLAEYPLHGAGFWNLMRPFPQGWVTLDCLFEVE